MPISTDKKIVFGTKTPEEKEEIKKIAGDLGKSMSEFSYEAVMERMENGQNKNSSDPKEWELVKWCVQKFIENRIQAEIPDELEPILMKAVNEIQEESA